MANSHNVPAAATTNPHSESVFLSTRDPRLNCLASSRAGLRNPVADRRFEHGQVDVAKCAELDAVPRHTRLADVTTVGPGQIRLVVESHDVHRDSARVGAQADLIELSGSPIGVGDGPESIPDVRVGDRLTALVLAIQKPQPAVGHQLQYHAVQRLHVTALGLRLSGKVVLDLCLYVHASLLSRVISVCYATQDRSADRCE